MHSYIHISLSFSLYTIYIVHNILTLHAHGLQTTCDMRCTSMRSCAFFCRAQAQLLPVPPIKNGDVMGFSADL